MSALSDALNEANTEGWSARDIARRSGDQVHFGTVSKYLAGRHGRPSEDVLQVFSEVLKIPMPRLRQLAGMPAGEGEPYEPPAEANRLDKRQRRLVNELIRMLVETKAGGDGDAGRDAASIVVDHVLPYPLNLRSVRNMVVHPKPGAGDAEFIGVDRALVQIGSYLDELLVRYNNDTHRAGMAVTEQYLADEIDDELFLLTQAGLREMQHSGQVAARPGQSIGRGLRQEQDRAAEESQDPSRE